MISHRDRVIVTFFLLFWCRVEVLAASFVLLGIPIIRLLQNSNKTKNRSQIRNGPGGSRKGVDKNACKNGGWGLL